MSLNAATEETYDGQMRYKNKQFTFEHSFQPACLLKLGVQMYGRRFFTQEEREMGAAKCMAPFDQIFIEPSGKTAPCCFMGNERIENVFRDGFEAVWFSEVMTKLRRKRYSALRCLHGVLAIRRPDGAHLGDASERGHAEFEARRRISHHRAV